MRERGVPRGESFWAAFRGGVTLGALLPADLKMLISYYKQKGGEVPAEEFFERGPRAGDVLAVKEGARGPYSIYTLTGNNFEERVLVGEAAKWKGVWDWDAQEYGEVGAEQLISPILEENAFDNPEGVVLWVESGGEIKQRSKEPLRFRLPEGVEIVEDGDFDDFDEEDFD